MAGDICSLIITVLLCLLWLRVLWTHSSPRAGTLQQRNLGTSPPRLLHLCDDQQLRPAIELEPLSPVWTLVPPHA